MGAGRALASRGAGFETGRVAVFLVPAVDQTYLSSSLAREVAKYGGDVSALVHPAVEKALREKYRRPPPP